MSKKTVFPAKSLVLLSLAFLLVSVCDADEIDDQIRVFSLVHADCNELAELLEDLAGDSLNIGVDERTNSLVMIDEDPQNLTVIEALLMKLDQEVEPKKRRKQLHAQKAPVVSKAVAGKGTLHASPKTGRLEWICDEGEHVQKGAVVARIVSSGNVEQAEQVAKKVAVQRAEAALRRAEVVHRQNVMETKLRLLERKLVMVNAEAKLQEKVASRQIEATRNKLELLERRARMVRESGRGDVAAVQIEVENTKAELDIQKLRLIFQSQHVYPLKQLEAQLTHEEHVTRLARIREERETHETANATREDVEKVRLERAKRHKQEKVTVVADRSGRVFYAMPLEEGMMLRARQPLLVIGDEE